MTVVYMYKYRGVCLSSVLECRRRYSSSSSIVVVVVVTCIWQAVADPGFAKEGRTIASTERELRTVQRGYGDKPQRGPGAESLVRC